MDSDPQILLHEIGPPFNSSGGAKIHRCCTDHFIRARFSDKLIKLEPTRYGGSNKQKTRAHASSRRFCVIFVLCDHQ
jgi:hypothetical protein